MDFAEPTYFIYCILPLFFLAGLVFLLNRRHKTLMQRLGSPDLIEQLSATVNWSGRRWKNWLWFAALVMLIVTLARPRWGVQSEYVERQGVEVMVALDISKSMLAEDLKPNRLDRAKLEISELMEALIGNDMGLVLFSGAAFVQFPLTSDFTTARSFLDSAHPGVISRPGTAIAEAIEIGMTGFNKERATQKVLVLLTDGENHEDDALGAATNAAEEGIIIYAIGFGSPEGEPIPEYDEYGTLLGYKEDQNGERVLTYLDETTLQDIALITGGRYFRATADGREVGFVADEIEKLQTSELESRFESRKIEQFQWFLAGAIIILLVVEAIPDRKHKNVRREYVKHEA
ncbi:VWA domain-containing protein [Anaerolineales bacterium HSG25]|nr:VWA domain-containing protein [Anaerolineales bacterium HSG25]